MAEGAPSNNVYVADLPPDVDEEWLKTTFSEYGTVAQCRAMAGKFPGQRGAALVRFATVDEAQWVVENLHGGTLQGFPHAIQVRYATNKASNKGQEKGGGGGSWGQDHDDGWGDEGGGRPPWREGPASYGKAYGKGWGGKDRWEGPDAWRGAPPQQHRLVPYEGGKGSPKGGKGRGPQGASCSSCDIDTFLGGLISAQALPGLGRKPQDHCLYVKGLPFNTTDADLYRIFSPFGAIPPRGVKTNLLPDGSCSGVAWVDFCEAG
eukprot:CAMPEP_0171206070 /NCGR_PEP_ID=MMETSP0790-20130122/26873_1 /TAXON_ID=2925 /ORGANISM="Alexandrium catenella, Strain OF101" /LENGTH=262 /DNA_ID=CAMNT_0011671603 /DNA_START=27 /DNA_END=811 /DNA_ORIENTATION=-